MQSVAQSQLLVSASVLLLAAFALVVRPHALGLPLFFGGIGLVFVATGLAVLVPWSLANKRWAAALPLLDLVAIALMQAAAPELSAELFLVFPVLWLARNFRLFGAIGGVTVATLLLWGGWAISGRAIAVADFPTLVLLPLTLAFISATTYATSRRTTGQRLLLRSQVLLTEAAFARARAQERSLEDILNAVEFGVLAFDRAGRVTLVNESHRRSLAEFGAARDAFVHPIAYQYDGLTPFTEEARPFSRALNGQSFENVIIWTGEPGDKRVAFSVTSRMLTTVDGEPDGGIVVLRDVTAELEAIKARDSLLASVSHELRTPLTSILGYLELALDDERVAPETLRMVDIAHRNSERLLSLVTDLLNAASDADEALSMRFQHCSIAEIVEQALDDQRAVANLSGIRLRGSISDRGPASADPLRIRQVIDNLLSNAIKYNRPGGEVVIAVETVDASIRVTVSDTGVGLSQDEISHLFDRFYRTESARLSSVAGSGLGLGITRDIVRQHGGELGVSSQLGVGTTFAMSLPTARPTAVASRSALRAPTPVD
ncbi:signal transduction histidine kinase [Glaciihabitans tibetensis]|uniref:histidine kinase n=1 Tax=Glaciihabitans tibetensis TaxID=1266600 RepID=A0A2T0VJQ3_9MICO|nr:PAS domain-containing sensor histidine kinase [Glaciihabitans tibetensis]PRY70447.1 signal transduction histidine kinase [Glaciihabitans tibetensis]